MWPENYAGMYFLAKSLGKPEVELQMHIQQAELYGPSSPLTAQVYVDYYLAQWPKLTTNQKIKTAQYILQQFSSWKGRKGMTRIINASPEKNRACELLKFNHIRLQGCMK